MNAVIPLETDLERMKDNLTTKSKEIKKYLAAMKKSVGYLRELNANNEHHQQLKIKINQHIYKLMVHYQEELSNFQSDYHLFNKSFEQLFQPNHY